MCTCNSAKAPGICFCSLSHFCVWKRLGLFQFYSFSFFFRFEIRQYLADSLASKMSVQEIAGAGFLFKLPVWILLLASKIILMNYFWIAPSPPLPSQACKVSSWVIQNCHNFFSFVGIRNKWMMIQQHNLYPGLELS